MRHDNPSGPQHGGSPVPQPKPRVDQMAVASMVAAGSTPRHHTTRLGAEQAGVHDRN
jgi:hypothetical protein